MATKKETLTHWKKQFNYEYLGAYSLADNDDEDKANYPPINVTIAKTGRKMVKTERGSEDCFVCWFKEKVGGENKPMILNKTNCAILGDIHSEFIELWVGKEVQLWVDQKVRAQGGEITKGLRLRAVPPVPKKPELTVKHPKWGDAKKSVQSGTTIDAIRKHYEITQENFDELCKPE